MARRLPLLALYSADAISVNGVITAVVAVAAAYLLVTLSIFLNPAMREMDRIPSGAQASRPAR